MCLRILVKRQNFIIKGMYSCERRDAKYKTCLKIILLMGRYKILEECFFSQLFIDVKHTKKLHKVSDRFSIQRQN